MRTIRLALGSFLFLALYGSTSLAQVQRTFLSALGSDGNPCSRSAPCRTLAQSIFQTNAAGEVVVLDSAGYGAFSINKSVSIIAPPGVYAGISVFSGDGIDINAGASDVVILRGLTINSQGGNNGIVFNTGGMLRVESCVVRGFGGGGTGIRFRSAGNLLIKDTAISDCGTGIGIGPASGTAQATIDHVTVDDCAAGVAMEPVTTGTVLGAIRDSSVSGSTSVGIFTGADPSTVALLDVERCLVANGSTAVQSDQAGGGASAISISNCLISHNSNAGFIVGPGTAIFSRGNNSFFGNGANQGSLTPAAAQ